MQLTHPFSSSLSQLRAFKTTGLSSRHIVVRYPKEVLTFCVYQPLANNPVDCMPVESYPFPSDLHTMCKRRQRRGAQRRKNGVR